MSNQSAASHSRIVPGFHFLTYAVVAVVAALAIYQFATRERNAYFDYNEAYNHSELKKKLGGG